MKHCNGCNQDKLESEFNKCKTKKDGLQTQCRECKKAYLRKYYHSEHGHQVTQNYHERNKEQRNAECREWYAKNVDKQKQKFRNYYAANKKRWVEFNKRWYEINKSYYRARDALRGKRKQAVNKFDSSEELWLLKEAMELARHRTVTTGFKWEVDHIIPISLGGFHSPDNIQVVPMWWNRRKANKHANRYFGA